MTELEYALRAVGFAVTLLGACAAVPAATWRLLRAVRIEVLKVLGQRAPAEVQLATAELNLTGSGLTTAAGEYRPGGTVEERLDQLEQRLKGVEKQQKKAATDLEQEVADRERADDELRGHVTAEVARLDRTLIEQQKTAEEVDARALPYVLYGLVLTTFPDVLSRNEIVGGLLFFVGLGVLTLAGLLLRNSRPTSAS